MNLDRFHASALTALRIVTGFLFFQHGLPKLFGFPTGADTATPFTQFWLSGILEVFGGFLIAIGLFVKPVAFLLAGEMAVAYFQVHLPRGFWPIGNGGELAALYCFVFLYLLARGGGSFSVDRWRSQQKR
jgi:putative oxidoreductase